MKYIGSFSILLCRMQIVLWLLKDVDTDIELCHILKVALFPSDLYVYKVFLYPTNSHQLNFKLADSAFFTFADFFFLLFL